MNRLNSLNLELARCVLLVKAAEESGLIPPEKRERATMEARPPEPRPGERGELTEEETRFLARRANILSKDLERPIPTAVSAGIPGWMTALAALIALALGFASNELGPERRISILSGPLLGLIVWNLAMYLILIFNAVRGGGQTGAAIASWLSGRQRRRAAGGKFEAAWLVRCAPLFRRQISAALHLCAALLAVGAVGGMYLRGLAFEYLAGWESTFLDAAAVHRVLGIVLGPASWLSSIPLPDVARLAELNWGAAGATGENAARWIHLYAITAALWIVVPRLVLAALAAVAARRVRTRFYTPRTDEDPYFRRVLAASRGGGQLAVVLPYAFEPGPATRETVRPMLHDLWGGRLKIDIRDPVAYGGEDEFLSGTDANDVAEYLVILMNLASTPEDENHGVLVAGLAREVSSGNLARELLVLLDGSAYRERVDEERVTQRRAAWERMLSSHGIGCAVMGLDDLEAVRRAVRQPEQA